MDEGQFLRSFREIPALRAVRFQDNLEQDFRLRDR
jgi:hypothetical protein